MSVSDAWLLKIKEGSYAAIGNLEMVHIYPAIPELIKKSGKNGDYEFKVLWQEQYLPLLDLNFILYGQATEDLKNMFLCIVSYMSEQENVQEHGAILSSQLPTRIKVDDNQACKLPEAPEGWSMLAISCFHDDEFGVVPILGLAGIFEKK